MKRFGRCFVLFCLFTVLLRSAASANSAPPDYRVAVRVVNGPEEAYYLDLLEQSDEEIEIFERDGLDQELLEAMKDAAPAGWRPCTGPAQCPRPSGRIIFPGIWRGKTVCTCSTDGIRQGCFGF